MFKYNNGVGVKDASLQYKLYEEGQDGMWNRIDATTSYDLGGGQMYYAALNVGQNLTEMEFGKNYVLEVMYQIIADGEYFFLGRDQEDTKFHFYYDSKTGIVPLSYEKARGETYNLAGQQVGEGYKGIVVSSGRKEMKR